MARSLLFSLALLLSAWFAASRRVAFSVNNLEGKKGEKGTFVMVRCLKATRPLPRAPQ